MTSASFGTTVTGNLATGILKAQLYAGGVLLGEQAFGSSFSFSGFTAYPGGTFTLNYVLSSVASGTVETRLTGTNGTNYIGNLYLENVKSVTLDGRDADTDEHRGGDPYAYLDADSHVDAYLDAHAHEDPDAFLYVDAYLFIHPHRDDERHRHTTVEILPSSLVDSALVEVLPYPNPSTDGTADLSYVVDGSVITGSALRPGTAVQSDATVILVSSRDRTACSGRTRCRAFVTVATSTIGTGRTLRGALANGLYYYTATLAKRYEVTKKTACSS
jgi:hypothetical protein